MLDKLDVYRISDPIFRVHARLFRVQDAILRSSRQQVRAAKATVVAQGTSSAALLGLILTLGFQIHPVSWPFPLVAGIIIVATSAIQYVQHKSLEQDEGVFNRLLLEASAEDIETWPDYCKSTIAAYGTRLKMTADALDEAEALYATKQLNETKLQQRSEYISRIAAYCYSQLEHYKKENDKLFRENKRSKSDYEEVMVFLDFARSQGPSREKSEPKEIGQSRQP